MTLHQVSASCEGEYCSMCRAPATHKVGEEIMGCDPQKMRHNLTAYVCCTHFHAIFGNAVPCVDSLNKERPRPFANESKSTIQSG
jgi:transcriptional regulator of met regulon